MAADHQRLADRYGLTAVTQSSNGPQMTEEGEMLQSSTPDVALVLGDGQDQGAGSLYITSR